MDDQNLLLLASKFRKLRDKVETLSVKQDEIQTIKGDQGPKGEQGDRGFDGAPGKDGDDGADGTNGQDGKDGVSVVNAEISFDGSLVIYLSDGREIDCGEVVRETGDTVIQTLKQGASVSGGGGITSITSTDGSVVITTVGGVVDLAINVFNSTTKGLVPASGGGTTNFLRADGTFAAPPAVTPASPTTSVQFNNAGAFGGSANFTYVTGTNTVSFGNITGSALGMTIKPKVPTSGNAGTLELITNNGASVNSNGGDLTLTLGSGLGTGVGGSFSLATGNVASDNGATFNINGATPGFGGSVISGSGYSSTGASGDFTFYLGGGATDDGNLYFQDSGGSNFIHCKTATPAGAQQIGFFNATPVVKPAPTASGTGNVLSSVVTALNSLGLVSSAALTNATSAQTGGVCWSLVGTTVVGDYTVLFKSPFAFTINETSMICVSGSATATVKINTTNVTGGTAVGGGSQSVGTTTTTISRTSANTVNAGDSIVVTFTAGAVNPSVQVKGTRT